MTNQDVKDADCIVLMKQFVSNAREFIAFQNDLSLASLNRCLGFIATSDSSTFCPGRLEVISFFASLWEVMALPGGPHWAGVTVLCKAVKDPSAKHSLVHTYRFFPTLANLLSDHLNFEKKIKLLSLMEELSYGIKINWQESYLAGLMKVLCGWAMSEYPGNEHWTRVGRTSLTVLVNLCYGNLQVVNTLTRTVDARELIKRLLSMKDDGSGGVQVCRLLVSLQGAQGAPSCHNVHNFLSVTLQAFLLGVKDCDSTQLRHSSSFLHDLCNDIQTKSHILTYERFDQPLQEAIKLFPHLISKTSRDNKESEGNLCLENTLQFLLTLVKTELYSLRSLYSAMVKLCIQTSHVTSCLGSIFGLLAAIVTQFHEDGMLPDELMSVISLKMSYLLAPSVIDSRTCGLQWLQLLSALCECNATQNSVLIHVQIEQFEEILYQILQNATQKGSLDTSHTRDSVVIGCMLCLDLAQISSPWDSVLQKMLSNASIQKILSSCLSDVNGERRKHALTIIKHPKFPSDKMNQVFCATECSTDQNTSMECVSTLSRTNTFPSEYPRLSVPASMNGPVLSPTQESSIDSLIDRLGQALENNQVEDVTTSSVMELYSYKMTCLEQRLHATTQSLQTATHNFTSMNHSMELLETTNRQQQEIMYRTQTHNERLKENTTQLSKQLDNAELTIKKFQGKLAAERLDREQQTANTKHIYDKKIKELESENTMKDSQLKDMEARLTAMDNDNNVLEKKLAEQTNKNGELTGILMKFEERIKQRDKRLEEVNTLNVNIKNDLSQAHQEIKALQTMLSEKDKKLEEMRKIPEVIANLMGTFHSNISN